MHQSPIAILTALLAALLCAAPAYGLEWSEIMFNPAGNDNGREFIELTGNRSMDGCTINDSASSDRIVLNRTGTQDVMLIIETDHLFADDPLGDATIYTIGAAIGNGLGNAAESIVISCGGATLLDTAYNISLIQEHKEGQSIIMTAHGWIAGPLDGTPGSIQPADAPVHPPSTPPPSNGTTNADGERCDDTLLVSLNTTSARVGDHVRIEIASAGYAAFDITADGAPFASGDTLTTRTHTIAAPDAEELKIVAAARECGNRQRAVRYLRITPRPLTMIDASPSEAQETAVAEVSLAATPAPPPAGQAADPPAQQAVPPLTGAAVERTVIDEDRDAVPWIAAFGMVTVLASAAVFSQLLRRGEA